MPAQAGPVGTSDIRSGRYGCPACTDRFFTLAEKKAHIRISHPKGS